MKDQKNEDKPKPTHVLDRLVKLHENYRDLIHIHQSKPLEVSKSKQTRWIWFSNNEIEKILRFVENAHPTLDNHQLGVKIYLGHHDKVIEPHTKESSYLKYEERQTLILAASVRNLDNSFLDVKKKNENGSEEFMGLFLKNGIVSHTHY